MVDAQNIKTKVLAVSYLFPNSQQPNHGIFVLNRLKALSRHVDVTVVNPIPWFPLAGLHGRYAAYNQLPGVETIEGLTVYHPKYFSIPGVAKGLEALTYRYAVTRCVKGLAKDFDLIDLHWTYPDLPAGIALKQSYQKPLLCTLRGMEAFHRGQGKTRIDHIDEGLKQADRIIALSQELKDTVDSITNQPDKSLVITNGVDTKAFYYIDQVEARKKLNLAEPEKEKIILGVGSLIYRKGFDLVIDALPALLRQYPNLKYYLLGSEGPEGDFRSALKAKIRMQGLEDVVVFQGAVPNSELLYWYNACDVFCLSSRGEGSPNVLTEALACGTPAVSTPVGASADIMIMANLEAFVALELNSSALGDLLHSSLALPFVRIDAADWFSQFDWDWCARKVLSAYSRTDAYSCEDGVCR